MTSPIFRLLTQLGFVILCAVLTASCDEAVDDDHVGALKEFDLLIHPDAIEVERHRVREYRLWQVDYTVRMSYPAIATDARQIRALIEMGWAECRGVLPGWQLYVDAVPEDGPFCVYRQDNRFQKSNMMLTIIHLYADPVGDDDNCPDIPTSQLQTVRITVHSDRDPAAMAARLGLTCSK